MIHLHVHSHFSFLDGASSPDRLLQRAAEMGMPALALTDHHGLYGAIRFMHTARLHGVKPIVGTEICIAREPDCPIPGGHHHLVLLARDRKGYANLCRIVTRAQLDHQDDPHIALRDLTAHAEGLTALSGCRRGQIPSLLLAREWDAALAAARHYEEIFGPHFYLEVEHHLLPDDTFLAGAMLRLAHEIGLPFVLTNDVHYSVPAEHRLRDVMACIQTRTTLEDWTDIRHVNAEYYLKSKEEMRIPFRFLSDRLFHLGVETTERIAAECTLELLAASSRPPEYPVPPGETPFSHLYSLCQEGARRLYRPLTPAVSNQLAHELSVIESMGLASFFLCVWDIVRFSREQGIRCAGRGSAADSIVAYVLGITAVDPLANNLLFERFLNPGRLEMPDVDIDFDSRRRDEVIAYIQERYTTEHAAMVANVITYRSRSAFRDVAKAMGFSSALIDHIASKLSYRGAHAMREELELAGVPLFGSPDSVSDATPTEPPSLPQPDTGEETTTKSTGDGDRAYQEGNGSIAEQSSSEVGREEATEGDLIQVIHLCEQLNGFPRHLSLHNGGMLITAEPLIDMVPLEYATSGVRVCQFNKDDIELLGLIKFDILGLRTLSIVDGAVQQIKENRGITVPIDDLTLDDPAVYDLICSSQTIGIFQIESPGQWNLLQRAQPRTFNDVIIQIALFRPGPLQGGMVHPYIERRQGREEVHYPHSSLEDALRDTLGVVIFQEQVLQVAHDFAGLSYADADGLRRAISHYRTEVQMDACREEFVQSAVRNGRDHDQAESIYEMIAYFSGYGFCRSHAAAFAKIVYQTAFLKTYYPAELLAGILSNEPCCYYPTQTVIEEARKWGIRTLPVDINRSGARYLAQGGAIRMGMMQVKGLSEETAEAVVQARESRSFTSLSDFWRRTTLDRDAVEHLIAVGAYDSLGTDRRRLLWELERVAREVPRRDESGFTGPLVNTRVPLPTLPRITPLEAASLDFTLQGASARYSVMSFYRRSLQAANVLSIGQLPGRPAGTLVRTAGIVISRQQPPTARGMTFLVLADEEGELPVAVYPHVFKRFRQVVNGTAALVVEGTLQRERYLPSLMAVRLWPLNDLAQIDAYPRLPGARQARLPS